MTIIRGRFAPTPSGFMHIGNGWTAVIAWLQARRAGGQFVLRMEDIDIQRCKPQLAQQAVDDLRWLGLDWDEGPDLGGPCAPYTQSQRIELYEAALARLESKNKLYPCFCTRAELQAVASAPHGLSTEGPAYTGTCRCLTPEQQEERIASKTPSLRFIVDDHAIVSFEDGIAGKQVLPQGLGGDFVVKRADGIISYQLAVVIDDAAMGITDVVRGYDLLDSTPRQLLLYNTLELSSPRFAHVPLLLGKDGNRLAKRHGDTSIASLRASGISPEQIIGWIAYLAGQLSKPEKLSLYELLSIFQLSRIPKKPITISQQLMNQLLQY